MGAEKNMYLFVVLFCHAVELLSHLLPCCTSEEIRHSAAIGAF